jgi:L-lactate dehydrogenase complex protein LldE
MRVSLFIPCLIDRFLPEIGRATVRLLESLGVDVSYDPRQTCCGQPAFNAGHPEEAIHLAKRMLRIFDGESPVVSPSGSCVAMVRDVYGLLDLPDEDMQRWNRLRENLFELSEFLVEDDLLGNIVVRRPGRVVVHHSCHHLRHTGGRSPLLSVLGKVGGLQVLESPEAQSCCGFGGVFSARLPELSMAMGTASLDAMLAQEPDYIALADAGCILHLKGLLDNREGSAKPPVVHYAQLLADPDLEQGATS